MNHEAICAHLPHAGRMCLLHRLVSWDQDNIVCVAISHRDMDNPLRHDNRLHVVTGIEYAAQAMALHGQLLPRLNTQTATELKADTVPPPPAIGYLAGVRDLSFQLADLGAVEQDLRVTAHRLGGDANGMIYEFEIHAGNLSVLNGRLAVKLLMTKNP